MINYEESYLNVFRPYSGDISLLNLIQGISISASGLETAVDMTKGAPSAKLMSIQSGPSVVTFTIEIMIPTLGISTTVNVSNTYSDRNIYVAVSHSVPTGLGTVHVDADILLNSFNISTLRLVSLFGRDPSRLIDLSDGYNVSVSVQGDNLYIIGGSGLGRGMYDGTTDEVTRDHYKGVKSINGLRSMRNVDIEFTDLLYENGAYVI